MCIVLFRRKFHRHSASVMNLARFQIIPFYACPTFMHSVPQISFGYFWTSLCHFDEWSTEPSLYRAYLLSASEIAFWSPVFHKLNEKSWSHWYFPRLRKRTLQKLRRKKLSCGTWKQIGRASNFMDFYFQGARKRPIRKSGNPKDCNASKNCNATRTSVL